MSAKLYFNDLQLPSFVKVTGIEETLLPTVDEEDYRYIKVNFNIWRYRMLSEEQLKEFSTWLQGDEFEYSKLTLPHRQGSYYMAIVDNSVEITDGLRSGSGTIEFKCRPNRISKSTNTVSFNTEQVIEYSGTISTYPRVKVDVLQQCSEIELSFSNRKNSNHIKLVGHFNQGQNIVIDTKTKKVTVDGVLNMQILTLDSYFHRLEPGNNLYSLLNGNGNITIDWTNEYLS
ncbi:phage distal tail protein [Turicibacter sanguinis]|uniref:phage distal tail protein n=1 Tax=Turicibacter sanguinis TaxID=154288 RepID=UPI0018ABDFEB|nr:phage tail domain-containing protein [Turicibacter sanguinis]MDB8553918.1 phage tail family protein [Turicibacter sanguinis]